MAISGGTYWRAASSNVSNLFGLGVGPPIEPLNFSDLRALRDRAIIELTLLGEGDDKVLESKYGLADMSDVVRIIVALLLQEGLLREERVSRGRDLAAETS